MVKVLEKEVGVTGYGLMGLTWRPRPQPAEDSFKAMKAALDGGAVMWNGGEIYGPPDANSLHLLNKYFTKYPDDADKVLLSIKGGLTIKDGHPVPDGSEENTRRSVDECLKVLDGKKKLDLFECARVDPKTPIEETMKVLNTYIKEGKLGGISLSEIGEKSIRKAASVAKISAVEIEFSMYSTEIFTNGVAKACKELDIPIVAYSPLGRGMLTGQVKSSDDIEDDDMRKNMPRFQPGNFEKNMELTRGVEELAKKKGCTATQIALAWVRAYSGRNGGPVIIPIPGATTPERINENNKEVKLSADDMKNLDDLVENCEVAGTRYAGALNNLNWG